MATNKHKLEKSKKKARKALLRAKNQLAANPVGLPDKETLLKFIAENPDLSGKRELAKAFNLKGESRVALKQMISKLQADGAIVKSGKRISRQGDLPPVTMIDIVTRDRDGGLLAVPVQWNERENGRPPAITVVVDSRKPGGAAGVGDRVLARLERIDDGGTPYRAKIIKRLEKKSSTILGVLQEIETLHGKEFRLEPVDRKQGEIAILDDAIGEAGHGDLVEVEAIRATKFGLKRGRVTRRIGSVHSEIAASFIAIHANDIRHVFGEDVVDEAQNASPFATSKHHEDWRSLPLITIDPGDAKDHDDAIFAEPDLEEESGESGGFIAYVAIADVSFYIPQNGAMDREARLRGNSVYFPDQVVPMLPERISNNLCSLREKEDRPALAVRMVFASNGRKIKHTFHRILMQSHAKLAYGEAQAEIDGTSISETAAKLKASVLEPLWEAYACLKRGRTNRSPLELDLPERKILLTDDGMVDRVFVPDRLDAHKLVEEFMIQANVCAAETLEQKRQPVVYRVHEPPSDDKLEKLREFLKSLDIPLARGGVLRPSHFNQILSRVKGGDKEELVNQVVLRSQSQALYSTENQGHFGLNLAKYAHFTSPIRRYADLCVHRSLVRALGLGPGALEKAGEDELPDVAAEISLAERKAMQAERDAVDRLIANHLADHIGERFVGRINGVTRAGLFVTLSDTGADGFVPISMLGEEYFHFDETTYAIIGENTGAVFQMGQHVEVKLVEAAPVAGALRFEMLSEGEPSSQLPRSRRSNTPVKRGKPGGSKFRRRRGNR